MVATGQGHLNNKHGLSPRHAFLQETRPVQEAEIGVCDREECKFCLGGGETFARETNSNIHRTRRNAGIRKVRGQAGETRLAYERPSHVDKEFAIGETNLEVMVRHRTRRRCACVRSQPMSKSEQ